MRAVATVRVRSFLPINERTSRAEMRGKGVQHEVVFHSKLRVGVQCGDLFAPIISTSASQAGVPLGYSVTASYSLTFYHEQLFF